MAKVTIAVDRELWKDLIRLKLEKNLNTFDDIVLYLLKNQKEEKKK